MAKRTRADYEKVKYSKVTGKFYFADNVVLSDAQLKKYAEIKGKPASTKPRVRSHFQHERFGSYFLKDTKFTTKQGHLQKWATPFGDQYNTGKEYKGYGKSKWAAKTKGAKFGGVLKGTKGWMQQIRLAIYRLGVQAEYFRIAIGHRALKVFDNSFESRRFAGEGAKWAPLAPYTIKKRAKRGTGRTILEEYHDLRKSLELIDTAGPGLTRIYTKEVPANSAHKKKRTLCYAGLHNDPPAGAVYGPRTGRGRHHKAYIRRQFMGHSATVDHFAFSIMRRFLFDGVFMVKG